MPDHALGGGRGPGGDPGPAGRPAGRDPAAGAGFLRARAGLALAGSAAAAALAIATFPPGTHAATTGLTALLSAALLAVGFRRPAGAMTALVVALPFVLVLPRVAGQTVGTMLFVAVALAGAGGVAAGRLARGEPSPLPPALRRFTWLFLGVAAASAVSSAFRGETLFLLLRGRAHPHFVNALYMAADERSRDAARVFLTLLLLYLAFEAFSRVARDGGGDRLVAALAASSFVGFAGSAAERFLPLELTGYPWKWIGRRAGTYADPNALGLLIGLVVPILLALALQKGRQRVVALGALALAPLALESSGSRTGLLLLGSALLLAGIGLVRERPRSRLALATAAVLVLGLVSFVVVRRAPRGGSASAGGLFARIGASASSSSLQELSSHRPIFWRTAFEMIGDEPLSGCGLGAFPYEFPVRFEKRHTPITVTDNATNALLDVAAETGIPGLLLALAVAVPLLVRALDAALGKGSPGRVRAAGAALGALAVASMTGSHLRFPDVAFVTALLAALLPPPPPGEAPELVPRRVPWVLAAAGILASFGAVLTTSGPDGAFRVGDWAGVYGWEVVSETSAHRWMGPRAFRRIRSGETSVSCALRNERPDDRPVLVTADLDGRVVQRLTVPHEETRYLNVDGIPAGTRTLRLVMEPSFVPYRITGRRDFRELSLRLEWASGEEKP